jgi:hypothetical protein
MKNQATFEWDDPEMKTPGHDRIMVWLHQNIDHCIKQIIPHKKHDSDQVFDDAARIFSENVARTKPMIASRLMGIEFPNPKSESLEQMELVKAVRYEWEKPVIANNKFIVGYVDMFVEARVFNHWSLDFKNDEAASMLLRQSKPSIDDVRNIFAWFPVYEKTNVYFEVKPKIKSLGDTIRQVQKYKVYDKRGLFALVSPDSRFKEILNHQDIPQIVVPSTITGDQ